MDILRKSGIPATLILDAAVGYFIEKVDMVLVGAEGVVENGGVINQVYNTISFSFLSFLPGVFSFFFFSKLKYEILIFFYFFLLYLISSIIFSPSFSYFSLKIFN